MLQFCFFLNLLTVFEFALGLFPVRFCVSTICIPSILDRSLRTLSNAKTYSVTPSFLFAACRKSDVLKKFRVNSQTVRDFP